MLLPVGNSGRLHQVYNREQSSPDLPPGGITTGLSRADKIYLSRMTARSIGFHEASYAVVAEYTARTITIIAVRSITRRYHHESL